ncbi:MAG: type II toxin-antitoxin system VapC family toxin [Candidatus Bathyarchaeia archaeon]|nr:type II toxin-antitoxin system VapC family toxin [Candidatus Bathyarchaeota archaeon]
MSLFDPSAIINLCGEKRLDRLLGGWTLNLAFYELGNAVWKQTHLHKAVKPEDAYIVLESLIEVFKRLKKPEAEDALRTLRLSLDEGITYYDASYIQAAIDNDLTLVTDDLQLHGIGRKYVKTVASSEI